MRKPVRFVFLSLPPLRIFTSCFVPFTIITKSKSERKPQNFGVVTRTGIQAVRVTNIWLTLLNGGTMMSLLATCAPCWSQKPMDGYLSAYSMLPPNVQQTCQQSNITAWPEADGTSGTGEKFYFTNPGYVLFTGWRTCTLWALRPLFGAHYYWAYTLVSTCNLLHFL